MTKVEELIKLIDEASTDEERADLARKLLELDPQNPYAKIVLWGTYDFEEEVKNLDLLREAQATLRSIVKGDTPAIADEEDDADAYGQVTSNLCMTLISDGKAEEAYELAKELFDYDEEDFFDSRLMLYRSMLDLGLYAEILEKVENDPVESVAGEHARAIALIETDAEREEIFDAVNSAISLDPNVALYITGILDMEDESMDLGMPTEEAQTMQYALYLLEPWSADERRIAFLGTAASLLGYILSMIEDKKMIKALESTYKELGLLNDIKKEAKRFLKMRDKVDFIEEIYDDALSVSADILSRIHKMYDVDEK